MAKDLSTKDRKKLSKKSFALPGKRKYPIPDKAHARNALARVAQHGTPAAKEGQGGREKALPGYRKEEGQEILIGGGGSAASGLHALGSPGGGPYHRGPGSGSVTGGGAPVLLPSARCRRLSRVPWNFGGGPG
jgi:hypothetical protein